MLDKEVTRKEFLLGALSIGALFVASKVPSVMKNSFTPLTKLKKDNNSNNYGNSSYGGKKNA